MKSHIVIASLEAAHRRGFSRGCMIDLSLPLHIDWMGGLTPAAYLDRVMSFGVTAAEVQLPPALSAAELDRWMALVAQVRERQLKLAIHAPIALGHTVWSKICAWIETLAAAPLTLIVHGCASGRPASGLVAQTIIHLRSLLVSVPPAVTVAVEQGWNWGMTIGFGASIRRLRATRWGKGEQRPTGVGSGMGAATPVPTKLTSSTADVYDPPLKGNWWRTTRRADGFSGTGTRQEVLQVVMEVNQPNCVIAWDLAHDWLGSARGGAPGWYSTPSADFLDRVGYVRLHDVDDHGCDHCPLVIGNVPYASQLRILLRHGFAGTVCLAIRYTPHMRVFGDRWHVLDRSLAVARQALRLN